MKCLELNTDCKFTLMCLVIVAFIASHCSKSNALTEPRRTGTNPPGSTINNITPPNPILKFDISWEQFDALIPRFTGDTVAYYPNSVENPGTGPVPVIVTDPTDNKNHVLNVTVNNDNRDGVRIRSELTAWNLTTGMRQKAAYGFRVFIPTNFRTDQHSMNFIQLHSISPYDRIPAIAFMLKQGQLDLNIAWATLPDAARHEDDVHKLFDVTDWYGRWVSVVMLVNWFPDNDGYVKLYFGDVLVYTYEGPVGYNGDTQGPYFKWGLHYPGGELPDGSTTGSQSVLFDNIRIGNNVGYDDVRP